MLWFHNHVGGAGGVLRIVSTTNGGQERKFIGGSQEISNRLALKQGLGCKYQMRILDAQDGTLAGFILIIQNIQ